MRQTARWAGWAIVALLAGAAACSEETEIAREPAQAGDQQGDASAGPMTPRGGKTDSIGTGGNSGAPTGEAGAASDAGTALASNGNAGSSGNTGASGSGSAGSPATPADAGVGIAGAGGVGGSGGAAGTAAGGSGGSVGPLTRCLVSGCSNTICDEQLAGPMITTCEFQAEYACYATATCERQSDGQCGWTQTQDLIDCIDNARGM